MISPLAWRSPRCSVRLMTLFCGRLIPARGRREGANDLLRIVRAAVADHEQLEFAECLEQNACDRAANTRSGECGDDDGYPGKHAKS